MPRAAEGRHRVGDGLGGPSLESTGEPTKMCLEAGLEPTAASFVAYPSSTRPPFRQTAGPTRPHHPGPSAAGTQAAKKPRETMGTLSVVAGFRHGLVTTLTVFQIYQRIMYSTCPVSDHRLVHDHIINTIAIIPLCLSPDRLAYARCHCCGASS